MGDERTFRARFAGTCSRCRGAVSVGDLITWNRTVKGVVYHAPTCPGKPEPAPQQQPPPRGQYEAPGGRYDYAPGQQQGQQQGGQPDGELGADEGQGQGDGQGEGEAQQQGQDEGQQQAPQQREGQGQQGQGGSQDNSLAKTLAEAVKPYLDGRLSGKADEEKLQRVLETARAADEALARKLGELEERVKPGPDGEQHVTLTIVVGQPDGPQRKIDSAHYDMPKLLYLIGKRKHAYLWGPPGAGKSHAAAQAAHALGLGYGYISLNPQTPESRLLGFIDATGQYRATPFYAAYKDGGVFCIDELDNAHPALLNTLNGMLENGLAAFPCGMVERHPDFVLVATGNTNGRGGNIHFPERRALDSAFAERFVFLNWEYDTHLERRLTLAANENAKPWLTWVRQARKFVLDNGIPKLFITPRAAIRGAELLKDSGWTLAAIAESVVFKGVGVDVTTKVLARCPLPVVENVTPDHAAFWGEVAKYTEAAELAAE